MDSDATISEESRRLAELLSQLVRLSGRSVRSIEQELGTGSSGLGKVLKGNIRLLVDHIVAILGVLGMTPGQFFQLAYPNRERLHPLVSALRKAQGVDREPEPEEAELEARTQRVLVKMMSDFVRQQDEKAGPKPSAKPASGPEEEEGVPLKPPEEPDDPES
jgi:hypothetical protein